MIPAKFDYAKAASVDDAVRLLGQGGEDAKVLAGGQSLIPLLRLRLAAPSLLVDVSGVGEMVGVRDDGDSIVIGASTTHADVLTNSLVNEYASLVAKATATVADRQVRHRGSKQAKRKIDPENGRPMQVLGQEAAEYRTADAGANPDDADISLITAALTRRDEVADERLRHRHDAAPARPLQAARENKEQNVRRDRAGERTGDEEADPP